MKPTDKQINYVHYLLKSSSSKTLQKLWHSLPTHDEKRLDGFVDYRAAILEDKLDKLTIGQISYLIDCLLNRYAHGSKKVVDFFNKHKLN